MTPSEIWGEVKQKVKRKWKLAFLSAVCVGLLVHMPVMLSDIPNHDGLDSMYFDQNMITSGRWFLSVACGFSSYYTLPWLIGLLGLLFLGVAAAVLVELLEVEKGWAVAACSGLLVTFPALASTFAYVFTLDGYMMALLLALLAVLCTKKYEKGFLAGGVCLAFSLGIYQGYLAFAMILSLYAVVMRWAGGESWQKKVRHTLHYLYMGVLGAVLYYGLLQVLLVLQGKELDTYQGINGMELGIASRKGGIFPALAGMYRDFAAFSLKGNVVFHNWISLAALVLLGVAAVFWGSAILHSRKGWKNPGFFAIMGVALVMLPLVTNIVLLISPDVTYHLLLRYQWVLFPIGLVAIVGQKDPDGEGAEGGLGTGKTGKGRTSREASEQGTTGKRVSGGKISSQGMRRILWEWTALVAAHVLVFFYGVTDNIGYSNLQKRYEKTYAYCVRLLDRIEQTEGYYTGIPIAMVGVVGDEPYPVTDITLPVTGNMIGLGGDILLYRGDNYREFIRHYLGATLNILPPEAMAEMYDTQEYVDMDSFPGEDSIRIIDGIMYIKTENRER